MVKKEKLYTLPKGKPNIFLPCPHGGRIEGFQRKDHWVLFIKLKGGDKLILSEAGKFADKSKLGESGIIGYYTMLWNTFFSALVKEYAEIK